MILTCPRCAARYVVGEDRVGPQGRKVKCTACGEVWRATQEPDFEIPADPYLIAPPEPEPVEAEPPAPEPQSQPQDELRQRIRARARRRGEQGRTVLWATLTTLVVVTVAVVVFRQEIALALETALR